MTWSIIARDSNGHFGLAIASRFFAVGALCVHSRRATGALSTQALMNPLYGPAGIDALAEGETAAQVVAALTDADAGRITGQLHAIGASRRAGGFHRCRLHRLVRTPVLRGFFGRRQHAGRAAGDRRDGAGVLAPRRGAPLAQRLVAAMAAGEAAGGDKRGRQGAALRIQAGEDYPALDLRVDDHPAPIDELQRLLEKSDERFQPFLACLAGRHDPVGITDRDEIQRRVDAFHDSLRARGDGSGSG